MAVGKPDFNLNSYGIKYFQKGDDDDLSDENFSQNQENISTVNNTGGVTQPKTSKELETAKLNTSLSTPNATGTGMRGASVARRAAAAQVASKPKVEPKITQETSNTIDRVREENAKKLEGVKESVKPKRTKDTKYVFNAEQNPEELSISQAKLLQDVNEARPKNTKPDPITGITPQKRRATSTTGVIANSANTTSGEEGGKIEDITEREKIENVGNKEELMDAGRITPKGYKKPKTDKTEEKKEKKTRGRPTGSKNEKEKETKDIDRKMGSRMVGNAPPEVKNTIEESHSNKKVRVGVGDKAGKEFDKREGVGAVHDEAELKTRPTGVVAKPDNDLNTINNKDNKRLSAHNAEMNKFLRSTKYTDAQKREYTAIANREDGREDHDARRAFVRNLTGQGSKTQEKVAQTKEEKAAEYAKDHADKMSGMKDRAAATQAAADSTTPPVGVTNPDAFYGNTDSTGKINSKDGTEVSTITGTNRKETTTGKKDNPASTKVIAEETEPKKITTDKIDDKIGAIATKLSQIKDPEEREKQRLELTGQKESDKSKDKIEAARKKVEAAKKKLQAGKTKKEVPKKGQLTPAQIKAYKKERELGKSADETIFKAISLKLDLMKGKFDPPSESSLDDINEDDTFEEKQRKLHSIANYHESKMGANSDYAKLTGGGHKANPRVLQVDKEPINDILTTNKLLKNQADETIYKAISLKLDLMNKNDDWDKNDKKRTEINEGIKQDTNQGNYGEHELVDLLSEMMGKKTGNVDGSRRAVQAALSGKKGKVGNTTVSMVGGKAPFGKKKIKKLGKSADETIYKAISLKLDLSKDL